MTRTRVKLLVGGLALAAGVSLLAVAGIREGWVYFLSVDQYVQQDAPPDRRVRLHGVVGEDDLDVRAGLMVASFDLEGERERLRVSYEGAIPDTFKTGLDVVVEGSMGEDGVFEADTLMTKCASKYESKEGEAPHSMPNKSAEEQE